MAMSSDFYIINGPITSELEMAVRQVVRESQESCSVFLTTHGGSADVAYRIGRLFQHKYKNVRFIIPGMCKSAGTLLVIAGNSLLMAETGELGPLDVQIMDGVKSSRNSGLDFNVSLQMARNEVMTSFEEAFHGMTAARVSRMHAIEAAGKVAQSVASALYAQIDPVMIAATRRSISIALEYGRRLAMRANTITEDRLLLLISGYPAHSFCIDRDEARDLFRQVDNLEDDEEAMRVFDANRDKIVSPRGECLVTRIEGKNDEQGNATQQGSATKPEKDSSTGTAKTKGRSPSRGNVPASGQGG